MALPVQVVTADTTKLRAGTDEISTTAAPLTSGLGRVILLQNDPTNLVDILVGDQAGQPFRLQPGDSLEVRVADYSQVWVKATSGTPTVNWLTS